MFSNKPTVKIKCDICKKTFLGKDIYHYSAIINGEINNHIHICKNCFNKLNLKLESIDLENITEGK